MRVLAGQAKGLRLKGTRGKATRPTSSRVRNAIFNILPARLLEGARVLDAYAGTGALGIEGLSHGASWVDFVERDQALCRLIRENVKAAGLGEAAHVYCTTVKKALGFLSEPYNVVLMDPPYAENGVVDIVAGIASAGLLIEDAVVVVEHAWRTSFPDTAGEMTLHRTHRYGDTAVTIYHRENRG